MADETPAPEAHSEVHFSDLKSQKSSGDESPLTKSAEDTQTHHDQYSEKATLLQSSRDLSVGVNPGFGYRHLVTFFCFLGCAMNYALRVNLSVALVAMVKHDDFEDFDPDNVTEEAICPSQPDAVTTGTTQQGEFEWDASTQGLILSAFFFGAMTTQLLGGVLAERFGGKIVFGFGIFLASLFTMLTPPMARQGAALLIVARVIEGIGEGLTVPAMYVLLSKWSPRLERTQFGAFAMAGANIGNVLGLSLTGILCDPTIAGWPTAFYTFGGLGLIWVLGWVLFIHEAPSKHPRISVLERNYILVTTGNREESPPTPWKSILRSPRLWAIAAAHFGKNWVYFTLLTTMPSYLRQVLKFDISQNGLLSSIPYLAMWAVEICGSQLLDLLRRKKVVSTTVARKVFNSLGVILTCIFLIVEGYVGCDQVLAIVILSLGTGFLGLTSCGFQVNHLDIAPLFAGTLMGITNNIATIPGIVAPSIVEAITEGKPLSSRWSIVFYISAGIHMLGGVVFALLASAKEQVWARHPSKPSLYTHF